MRKAPFSQSMAQTSPDFCQSSALCHFLLMSSEMLYCISAERPDERTLVIGQTWLSPGSALLALIIG